MRTDNVQQSAAFALTLCLLLLGISASNANGTTQSVTDMPSFTIKTNAGSNNREQYGLHIQQDLARLGVEVILEYEEWGVFLGEIFAGDFQSFVLGWAGGIDPDWSVVYHSEGGLNFYFLNDSLNDQLLDAGLATIDPYERREVYDQWQEHFMNDLLPIIPICAGHSYVGNWAQLDGYDATEGLQACLPDMRWSEPSERGTSDDIVVSTFADSVTLFDLHVSDTASREVTDMLFPRLVEYNGESLIEANYGNSLSYTVPSIEITEDGEVELTFYLRDDLFWEDGVQINATDVEFMWDCVLNYNQTGYPYASTYDGVLFDNSTEIVSEFVYRVTYPTVYGSAYYDASGAAILPAHILNLCNSTGHELFDGIQDTFVWQEFAKHPLSGGAWYLDHWTDDEETLLRLRDNSSDSREFYTNLAALSTAFTSDSINGVTGFYIPPTLDNTPWWDQSSYTIKTWTRRVVNDVDDEMIEFYAGNVDIAGLEHEYIPDVSDDPQFELQTVPNSGLNYLGFNMNDGLLGTGEDTPVGAEGNGGLHLRKAIAYAMDREKMVEEIRSGYGEVVHSPMYPAQAFWYHPVVYEFDLEKAVIEFEAAGYTVPASTTTTSEMHNQTTTVVTTPVTTTNKGHSDANVGLKLSLGHLICPCMAAFAFRFVRRKHKRSNQRKME